MVTKENGDVWVLYPWKRHAPMQFILPCRKYVNEMNYLVVEIVIVYDSRLGTLSLSSIIYVCFCG